MPITRTPIFDDDGSGQTGTVLDNAWKQEFYGQIDALVLGATGGATWTARPYVAGNYAGLGALVWAPSAGLVTADRYCVIGKTLIWTVNIGSSTLTGSPAAGVRIYGPHLSKSSLSLPLAYGWDGTAHRTMNIYTYAGGTHVDVMRQDYGTIPPGAGFYFAFTYVGEIQ